MLVYIDDATGKLLHLAFAPSETTNAYFGATKTYLKHHGKPLAFYVDRHGVFRVNTTKSLSARVEKVNQTLQDRLVKELRLQGINTMEEGNQFLSIFMEAFNRKFAVIPTSPVNLHRPLAPQDILEDILIQKHPRRLSKQLTLSYESRIYQIQTDHPMYAMRHAVVTV